jgi:hypothetical protein
MFMKNIRRPLASLVVGIQADNSGLVELALPARSRGRAGLEDRTGELLFYPLHACWVTRNRLVAPDNLLDDVGGAFHASCLANRFLHAPGSFSISAVGR